MRIISHPEKLLVFFFYKTTKRKISMSVYTWNTMFAWQYGPENEMGPTRNSDSDGTITVDASTLQAAAHAAWNACDAP